MVKVDYSKYRILSADIFEKEKQRDKERKKHFKLVKKYETYDIYEHKKYGYRECFNK